MMIQAKTMQKVQKFHNNGADPIAALKYCKKFRIAQAFRVIEHKVSRRETALKRHIYLQELVEADQQPDMRHLMFKQRKRRNFGAEFIELREEGYRDSRCEMQ